MLFKQISFDEFLSFPYLALAIPGYPDLTTEEVRKYADTECVKLLRTDIGLQDYLGNPLLRNQIKKNFFNKIEGEVVVRSNIYDFIILLSANIKLQEIQLPFIINSTDQIYHFVNQFLSSSEDNQAYYYIIDEWGLDSSKFENRSQFLIISSIEALYGLKGLNICWAQIFNDKIYKFIEDYASYSGPSCSHYTEIYGLIALRNHHLMKSLNNKIIKDNRNELEQFLLANKMHLEYEEAPLRTFCKIYFNKELSEKEIRDEARVIIHQNTQDKCFIIHFGQKNFISSLKALDKYLRYKF